MPITANIGLMGSGKTFDAVREKIVTGVMQGRRVVTNIEGINPDRIYDYVERKFNIPASSIGEVVPVLLDRPGQPGFFPSKIYPHDHPTDAGRVDDSNSIVKGGDLVVIDEARRFWESNLKIPEEHKIFFAEHRHYTGKNNISCDLVYIIQDMKSVHRALRGLTELTFKFKKLKTFGLGKYYVVNQWEGTTLTKALVISTFNKKYDAEIFPLYKSYSGAEPGKELTVDRRQNVLAQKKIWFMVAGVVIMSCISARLVWNVFHTNYAKKSDTAEIAGPTRTGSVGTAVPGSPLNPMPAAAPKSPKLSETWRISGTFEDRNGRYVLLVSKDGRTRLVEPTPRWTYVAGRYVAGVVDDELVGTYTATPPDRAPAPPPRNLAP